MISTLGGIFDALEQRASRALQGAASQAAGAATPQISATIQAEVDRAMSRAFALGVAAFGVIALGVFVAQRRAA